MFSAVVWILISSSGSREWERLVMAVRNSRFIVSTRRVLDAEEGSYSMHVRNLLRETNDNGLFWR